MAPDLAVYLYRDALARGLRPDILRRKGLRSPVQWPLRQDVGEDVGPQETAHLLDEHDLQLATSQGSVFGYLEVPSVVVAVGNDGQLPHVGRFPVYEVQVRQVAPEVHFERDEREARDLR